MPKKIIIGNWKMNPLSAKEAEKLFADTAKLVAKSKKSNIVFCPPFIFLERLKRISKKIALGSQDLFWEAKGAFTGEVSAKMLAEAGVKYAIVGHSERRNPVVGSGESNGEINKKIKSALSSGITPILCIGESIRDEKHLYLRFIKTQIEEGLNGIAKNSISQVIIAYEPIWAIGVNATREATAEEFLEISIFIRKILSDKFGAKSVADLQIIYGGSAHPENALNFLSVGRADGFLVGRDSLDPKKFSEIVSVVEKLN